MVELVIDPTLLILDLGILVISSGVISSHIFISHSELINNIKKKIIEIVKMPDAPAPRSSADEPIGHHLTYLVNLFFFLSALCSDCNLHRPLSSLFLFFSVFLSSLRLHQSVAQSDAAATNKIYSSWCQIDQIQEIRTHWPILSDKPPDD